VLWLTMRAKYNPYKGNENGSGCRMVSRRESGTAKLHLDAFNGHVSAYMKEP